MINLEHASEILSIIEAGLEGNKKKAFAHADLLWHKLDESDTLKKAIENRLSGAYRSMPVLQAMKSYYKNHLKLDDVKDMYEKFEKGIKIVGFRQLPVGARDVSEALVDLNNRVKELEKGA